MPRSRQPFKGQKELRRSPIQTLMRIKMLRVIQRFDLKMINSRDSTKRKRARLLIWSWIGLNGKSTLTMWGNFLCFSRGTRNVRAWGYLLTFWLVMYKFLTIIECLALKRTSIRWGVSSLKRITSKQGKNKSNRWINSSKWTKSRSINTIYSCQWNTPFWKRSRSKSTTWGLPNWRESNSQEPISSSSNSKRFCCTWANILMLEENKSSKGWYCEWQL